MGHQKYILKFLHPTIFVLWLSLDEVNPYEMVWKSLYILLALALFFH